MKKKILSILMISALILSGCSGKGTVSNSATTSTSPATNAQASKESGSSASSNGRVEVKTDFKEVKAGTVPQLSVKQKTEVNTKVNATVNDLSKILDSIEDAQDIDLNSVN